MNTQKTGRSKLAAQAVQFFYNTAGYAFDPKTETEAQGRLRGAKALAKAERDAASAGITFEWRYDFELSSEDNDDRWQAVALNAEGDVVAALGGIELVSNLATTDPYRRVVNAELALEALTQ